MPPGTLPRTYTVELLVNVSSLRIVRPPHSSPVAFKAIFSSLQVHAAWTWITLWEGIPWRKSLTVLSFELERKICSWGAYLARRKWGVRLIVFIPKDNQTWGTSVKWRTSGFAPWREALVKNVQPLDPWSCSAFIRMVEIDDWEGWLRCIIEVGYCDG